MVMEYPKRLCVICSSCEFHISLHFTIDFPFSVFKNSIRTDYGSAEFMCFIFITNYNFHETELISCLYTLLNGSLTDPLIAIVRTGGEILLLWHAFDWSGNRSICQSSQPFWKIFTLG